MAGRIAGRGAGSGAGVVLGFGLGALWWWAVVRLAVTPDAGALEGAVAAGGWGLSLLPVHCVARSRALGVVARGRWRAAWRGTERPREREAGVAGERGAGDGEEGAERGEAEGGRVAGRRG
nr:hypothetical protein [Streptomyces sp. LUP30]